MSDRNRELFELDASRLEHAIATMRRRFSAFASAPDPATSTLDDRTRRVLESWSTSLVAVETAYAELLRRSRRRADAVSSQLRRKDEVMATVGHELRNPLSTIATGLEVLRHQPHTGPVLAGERTFRIVRDQVSHMTRLLDDLLQTRRDAAMQLQLSLSPVAIGALCEQAALAVEDRVRSRRQRLALELPSQEIRVRVDAGRLLQVVMNLLDNASKYTDDGGRLGLRVEADERTCVVRVWDEGIGIAGDEVDRIRAMFTQGHGLPGRVPSGMGIGLGLAGRIVELHGGQLEIVSRDQGRPQGTEVVVRLGREMAPQVERPPTAPHPLATTALKILVVDGHRDHAALMARLLEARGHVVRIAARSLQALELTADELPDLVVLDVDLPTIDGYELGRRIRELSRHAKIFGMSGFPADPERAAAFDGYVMKPVGTAQLDGLLGACGHPPQPWQPR